MNPNFKIPTETVELPSKGLLYPKDSPLASGTIEMKYMTAKEEDILSNTNYMRKGIVLDKLMQSLIVTENFDYNDLLIGDKNAIMIAARVLSYGKDYTVNYLGEDIVVDLSKFDNKEVDPEVFKDGKNEFEFKLPKTDNLVKFKLLTHKDQKNIDSELAGLKKLNKDDSSASTTRLKYLITGVNGTTEQKDIREFVDKYLLASDARALRSYYAIIQPDVNMKFTYTDEEGGEEEVDLPIGVDFFWPDTRG